MLGSEHAQEALVKGLRCGKILRVQCLAKSADLLLGGRVLRQPQGSGAFREDQPSLRGLCPRQSRGELFELGDLLIHREDSVGGRARQCRDGCVDGVHARTEPPEIVEWLGDQQAHHAEDEECASEDRGIASLVTLGLGQDLGQRSDARIVLGHRAQGASVGVRRAPKSAAMSQAVALFDLPLDVRFALASLEFADVDLQFGVVVLRLRQLTPLPQRFVETSRLFVDMGGFRQRAELRPPELAALLLQFRVDAVRLDIGAG